MRKRIILSIKMIKRIECGRVQLFNKHFYRICNGKAIRQFPIYKDGNPSFEDWGKEIDIQNIYYQIKLLLDPLGKIVASRIDQNEPLITKPDSVWHRTIVAKREPLSTNKELMKKYHEEEALDYYRWLKNIRTYSYEKYGRHKTN